MNQNHDGTTSFFHYDGLGSTRSLSDSSGNLTDTYNYEAFGELLNLTGTTDNDYLFAGEQLDANLEQYYLRARYYDQGIGRFTQQDTWMGNSSDPVTLHKYLYANADPVRYTDPTGNFSLGSIGTAGNIAARLAMTSLQAYDFASTLYSFAKGDLTIGELAFTFLASRVLPTRLFKCKNSFVGGTLIHTEFGLIPINEISIGDRVWSYNEETGKKSLQEVIHLVSGDGTKELVDIELLSGEVVTTTGNHPFYLPELATWTNASDLNDTSVLSGYNGSILIIDSLSSYSKKTTVYNLSVANDHNYYVGSTGVLAHNCYQKPNSIDYRKHVPKKKWSRQDTIKSTKSGDAKYFMKNTHDIQKFELDSWKKGVLTTNGKPWKVVEFPEEIGAYNGKAVRWLRLEFSEGGNVIHGHPISIEQYRKLLK